LDSRLDFQALLLLISFLLPDYSTFISVSVDLEHTKFVYSTLYSCASYSCIIELTLWYKSRNLTAWKLNVYGPLYLVVGPPVLCCWTPKMVWNE